MSLKVTSHGSSKDTVSTEVSCNLIGQPIFIGTCFFVRGKTAIPFEHYSQNDKGGALLSLPVLALPPGAFFLAVSSEFNNEFVIPRGSDL